MDYRDYFNMQSDKLINAKELADYFFYGVKDEPILSSAEDDMLVIDIINEQPGVDAIPREKILIALNQMRSAMDSLDLPKTTDEYNMGYWTGVADCRNLLFEIISDLMNAEEG